MMIEALAAGKAGSCKTQIVSLCVFVYLLSNPECEDEDSGEEGEGGGDVCWTKVFIFVFSYI